MKLSILHEEPTRNYRERSRHVKRFDNQPDEPHYLAEADIDLRGAYDKYSFRDDILAAVKFVTENSTDIDYINISKLGTKKGLAGLAFEAVGKRSADTSFIFAKFRHGEVVEEKRNMSYSQFMKITSWAHTISKSYKIRANMLSNKIFKQVLFFLKSA